MEDRTKLIHEPLENRIKLFYLRTTNKSDGVVCVATTRDGSGLIHYALAMCSPKEKTFDKEKARLIALARLRKKPHPETFEAERGVKMRIIWAISRDSTLPSFARKLAHGWIQNHRMIWPWFQTPVSTP